MHARAAPKYAYIFPLIFVVSCLSSIARVINPVCVCVGWPANRYFDYGYICEHDFHIYITCLQFRLSL